MSQFLQSGPQNSSRRRPTRLILRRDSPDPNAPGKATDREEEEEQKCEPPGPRNKAAEAGRTVKRDVFISHPLLLPLYDDEELVENTGSFDSCFGSAWSQRACVYVYTDGIEVQRGEEGWLESLW